MSNIPVVRARIISPNHSEIRNQKITKNCYTPCVWSYKWQKPSKYFCS